jgi:hypothetical protein
MITARSVEVTPGTRSYLAFGPFPRDTVVESALLVFPSVGGVVWNFRIGAASSVASAAEDMDAAELMTDTLTGFNPPGDSVTLDLTVPLRHTLQTFRLVVVEAYHDDGMSARRLNVALDVGLPPPMQISAIDIQPEQGTRATAPDPIGEALSRLFSEEAAARTPARTGGPRSATPKMAPSLKFKLMVMEAITQMMAALKPQLPQLPPRKD